MNKKEVKNTGELIIYSGQKGGVELRADVGKETIWGTQDQIAKLFGIQRPAITKHFKNIFDSGELNENSVSSILEHTAEDGKKYKVKFYNLDAILSVGYRVNSKQATQFRIWATKTLREYLMKGIVMNTDRIKQLPEKILKDLDQKIKFIQRTIQRRELNKNEVDGLLSVIDGYSNAWLLLKEYDEGGILLKKSKGKEKRRFDYEFVRPAVDRLKENLIGKAEAGELFSSERDGSFQGILKTIYQTFGGKELYSSLEEKAAHLLYFIIKDHPFSDGNKRVGSFLFISFLQINGILIRPNGEKKINDNTLVALALLIAESDPKEKEVMVALVTNLLVS
ncbi:MAG: virulence protein RhuM/Fic/DOC family protein [Candidatus Paceibacterota bacterium]|jgi:prophage maintenance system killer protein